ncbi:hypothetical protein ACLKA7_002720 [Drosophila subpalustris]
MSHLPLDARAILQHLNELGYRNISAEQLREFLKAYLRLKQPQPEFHQQQPPSHQRSKVKVIKSKRPLCHFKFYLDICDHQLTKRIESEIKALGGTLEFFLNDSITHFITDKEKSLTVSPAAAVHPNSRSRPGTPLTPATPNTPSASAIINEDVTGIQRKGRQTRADTILSRVREAQQSPSNPNPNPSQQKQQRHTNDSGKQTSYIVWQTEYALRFFQRIQTELRQYLQSSGAEVSVTGTGNADRSANIQLKGNFIKIESIKRNHRPYYHLLKQPEEWPKLDLTSDDGAFRLQAKKAVDVQSMTRKSLGSRTSQRQQDKDKDKDKTHKEQAQQLLVPPLQHAAVQACKKQTASIQTPDSPRSHYRDLKESSDKQCGVCEICKIEYDTLTIHLQSKDHELFAKNANNFLGLDTLIQVSASLNGFLQREEQQQQQQETEQKDIEIYSDMDVDELLSDSAIALTLKSINNPTDNINNSSGNNNTNNNNRQRPSPVLREKSKRITKGKHSSEKFQATTPNSPTNPATPSPSPTKKVTSLVELQRMDNDATTTTAAATPTNLTRRKTNNSVLSPPMRAMLPPSSLYKVVQEASDATGTPPRIRRGAGATTANMDSPSLIVKFQKVRQSELQRLNGEAENFMFPRTTTTTTTTTTRSSSELLTDVDRQTTSDARGHQSISSTSIDSTSELDVVGTPGCHGRAAAVGRRRKGAGAGVGTTAGVLRQLSTGSSSSNGSGQQRFPSAPIQPEMQSQLLKSRQSTSTTAATRKSSRMATAIVTAATTSSQLQLRQKTQSKRGGVSSKLEDGMGEQTRAITQRKKTAKQVEEAEQEEEQQTLLVVKQEEEDDEDEDEDEDEDDDVSSCSSDSDEDYVVANTKLHKSLPATGAVNRVDTREERAARRLSRLTISSINRRAGEDQALAALLKKSTAGRRSIKSQKRTTPKSSKQVKQQTPAATSTPSSSTSSSKGATTTTTTTTSLANELMFDCSKSERLLKLRYAFEELPSAELWHQVFQRQDAGQEHYYSYYGSTRYRKLPYEMGPIPMERTKSHNCQMCQATVGIESKPQIKLEREREREQQSDSNQTTTTTTCSMYKHKKLHLLQRYQQEQQQQQLQQLKIALPLAKCDSKASTPELMERDLAPLSERAQLLEVERVRAASTQSSASSSCSNSQKSCQSRNKQLARVVDLPPRKSPREHASTLALVSCIIRQRQDSQSKTNSEAEEPPPVKLKKPQEKEPEPEPETVAVATAFTPTPVEELRFATEISETVKRMRRGQNKYDVVPTATTTTTAKVPSTDCTAMSARCRRPTAAAVSYSRRLELARREVNSSKRQQRRPAAVPAAVRPNPQQPPGMSLAAGVRKLPSKKGLLEYEMEDRALKALDASMQYVNPTLIAWQIDKYLELTNRDYDLNLEDALPGSTDDPMRDQVQTPPPTDYGFTSEFDLCDLVANSAGSGDDDEISSRSGCRRNSRTNLFSSYQRKRKCLKSNRTGWPRVQRRRAARAPNELGAFENLKTRKGLKQEPLETEEEQTTTTTTTTTTAADKEIHREPDDDQDGGDGDGDVQAADKEQTTREDAVMTPPATDVDEQVDVDNEDSNIVDDDDETMADSVDQQPNDEEAEIEATDADVEEDEDEEEEEEVEDEDVFEDAYGEEHEQETQQDPLELPADEPPAKRERITITKNPVDPAKEDQEQSALITLNGYCLNVTSTPSTRQPRQQQLNGSLGSCISPSDKLGDNSDIFTVSSDGLDTDMDLSNTQAGDSLDHCHLHHHQATPPKRKFDISKYAPPNNNKAASSCAAEAATAAVKSLAISQFLKKEVRVTCRRLRAPFHLRKLIKYDERLAAYSKEDYFSSLHKRATLSSRAKLGDNTGGNGNADKENVPAKQTDRMSGGSKDSPNSDKGSDVLNVACLLQDQLSLDTAKKPSKENDCKRRSRSKTRKHPNQMTRGASSDESDRVPSRSKLRRSSRPRSTGRFSNRGQVQVKHKQKNPHSDPVALYHYYQNEWAHFRHQIPGSNSHPDQRWGVRPKPKAPK